MTAALAELRPETKAALQNLDAEMALLGCVLCDASATLDLVADMLRPDDFSEPFFGLMFETALCRFRAGQGVDPITMHEAVKTEPALAAYGGLQFLGDLVDKAPPPASAPDYAQIIGDLSQRRGLVRFAADVGARAQNDTLQTAAEITTAAERQLGELASRGPVKSAWSPGFKVITNAIDRAIARGGRIEFPSGLLDLDRLAGGFTAGEVTILAGRPGMGKSVAGVTFAKASASEGLGTCVFSQEMAEEQLGLRLACDLAFERDTVVYSMTPDSSRNPTFDRARKGELSPEQWDRLREAAATVRGWPLQFDTRPGLTPSTIEACARRAHRHWERKGIKPGPVIIDHLGITRPENDRKGSKVAETADVSRAFAEMAKRLGVPVIALCQLNRANEGRDNKQPQLADLRWAGELEQDARQVIFLYRPEYYLFEPAGEETLEERIERETKLARARHKLFFIVAKNNSGLLGSVETFCDIGCSAIRDRMGA